MKHAYFEKSLKVIPGRPARGQQLSSEQPRTQSLIFAARHTPALGMRLSSEISLTALSQLPGCLSSSHINYPVDRVL